MWNRRFVSIVNMKYSIVNVINWVLNVYLQGPILLFLNNQQMGYRMMLKICIQGTDWRAANENTESHAAHKFLLVCNTQSLTGVLLTSVRHTTYRSRAAHQIYLMCTTWILLTSSSFHVTHVCWLSHLTKIEDNMCVRCTQVSTWMWAVPYMYMYTPHSITHFGKKKFQVTMKT